MTREDFVAFLKKHDVAEALHPDGELAGLPKQVTEALRVADAARQMGLRMPSSEDIRRWYCASEVDPLHTNPARRVIEGLNLLCSDDFVALSQEELLLFSMRCATVSHVARSVFHDRREQLL